MRPGRSERRGCREAGSWWGPPGSEKGLGLTLCTTHPLCQVLGGWGAAAGVGGGPAGCESLLWRDALGLKPESP